MSFHLPLPLPIVNSRFHILLQFFTSTSLSSTHFHILLHASISNFHFSFPLPLVFSRHTSKIRTKKARICVQLCSYVQFKVLLPYLHFLLSPGKSHSVVPEPNPGGGLRQIRDLKKPGNRVLRGRRALRSETRFSCKLFLCPTLKHLFHT
jgi:hypothetical protein